LFGGGSTDNVNGGSGDDTIAASLEDDNLVGAAGLDIVDMSVATSGVTVTLAGYATVGSAVSAELGTDNLVSIEGAIGGAGDDTLTGFDATSAGLGNWFYGGGGDDVITGNAGADTLRGGQGNDAFNGAAGNDQIHGGQGADVVDAGAGNDIVNGGTGADSISLGSGDDDADGWGGFDTIDGGDGNDTIYGFKGGDSLLGGAGTDSILGENGLDVLDGGTGSDTLVGGAGNDNMSDGDDTAGEVDWFLYEADTLGTADVVAGGADTITASDDDFLRMDGLLDELLYNDTVLSALTGDVALGNAIDSVNSIAYDDTVHQLQIDVNGDGAFVAADDFMIQFSDNIVSVTFLGSATDQFDLG
jgi:Ca2+-binding RTX toxin-like protein